MRRRNIMISRNTNRRLLRERSTYEHTWNFLMKHNIRNFTVNRDTLEVDVNGNVDISQKGLTKIPIQFNHVTGDFKCNNQRLQSLEGAPRMVGGHFFCQNNYLDSLKGAPQKVGGHFVCDFNELTTLKDAPRTVGEDFICYGNYLTSLKGAPKKVGKNFDCSNNTVEFKITDVLRVSDVKGEVVV